MVKRWKKNKKFGKLPLHQIDACVIIENFTKPRKKKEKQQKDRCLKYIQNIGHKYKASVSIPALGEVCKTILTKVPERVEREKAFSDLGDLFTAKRIQFSSPQKSAYKKAIEIMDFDPLIESADALRYAEAIQSKADKFVTLEEERLVNNKRLQRKFGVKIRLP